MEKGGKNMDFTGRTAFLKNSSEAGTIVSSRFDNEQQILDIELNGEIQQFSHDSVVILGDMQFNSKQEEIELEKHFEEEIKWLSDKIDFLKKADKANVYKDEIKMLVRIKNNYEFYKNKSDELSSELSWTKNPEPGY